MAVQRVLAEAALLPPGSVPRAQHIDYASSGDELGRIMRSAMDENGGAYAAVRGAVQRRVGELGGAGQAEGLFMLAADMATTEALVGEDLDDDQRSELRALWLDLLRQG